MFSKSKRMKKVLDYVHKENDADKRINELETKQAVSDARIEHAIIELKRLDKMAHPPF